MDVTAFFDYLHERDTTARLADALAEILCARRTRMQLRRIPIDTRARPFAARSTS